jgi:hypothetical protein
MSRHASEAQPSRWVGVTIMLVAAVLLSAFVWCVAT